MKVEEAFPCPYLRAQAQDIVDSFQEPNVDGHDLFTRLKSLLIRQEEWKFEQVIKDHPFGMEIPSQQRFDQVDDDMQEWLNNQFSKEDYVALPGPNAGIYSDKHNWIYFRKKDQAALFKLAWV